LTVCHGRGSPFYPPIADQPWAGPGNMPDQSFLISVRQCSFAVPHRWSTASRTLSHDKLCRTVDMPPTYERIESRTTCCHTPGRESESGAGVCGGVIGMPSAGAGKNNRRGAEAQRNTAIRRPSGIDPLRLCATQPHLPRIPLTGTGPVSGDFDGWASW
jgi:hypothetical protein